MKHMTRKRLLWTTSAVGLLLLAKFVIYDELVRCRDQTMIEKPIERPLEQYSPTHLPPPSQPPNLVEPFVSELEEQMRSVSKIFEATVRSCLGSKCFDMPANGVERIGLLAPPGSGADFLHNILKRVHSNIPSDKLEVVSESHVPAYGYGKNHGWSRIIRLVRSPIPQAFHLFHHQAKSLSSAESLSLLDSQVRQLVRWHCRLSHVAAHTRMLSGLAFDLPVANFPHLA
jgi:hypothetical protein